MRARASPGAKGACCYGDAPSWLRCHSHEASANGMDSTLPAVAEELLKEIKKAFQETSRVPDDLLLGHDAWAVTGGGIHNQLINNLIQGNSSRPPAEVHLWPMCCPSFGFGGSPFCHSSHVPQWKDCIPGGGNHRFPSGEGTPGQVLGSSGKLYTCYSSCHFCTCPAFGFTVLQKSESLLCKHILAVYLSQAMGACQELTVSEEQLTSILLADEEDEG